MKSRDASCHNDCSLVVVVVAAYVIGNLTDVQKIELEPTLKVILVLPNFPLISTNLEAGEERKGRDVLGCLVTDTVVP